MSISVESFWEKLKHKHKGKNHGVYKLNEFRNIPETPGIYSWHISTNNSKPNDYHKIFKQKKVKVKVNGNLKEEYLGEAKRTYYDNNYDAKLDSDLFEMASIAFCPPLYIGISINLGKRLNDHLRELEKIYFEKKALPKPVEIGQTDFDTIVESKHFAQRFGFSILEMSQVTLSSVFIKTIELDNTYKWSELQKVEKYLNRTFIPIYGRK